MPTTRAWGDVAPALGKETLEVIGELGFEKMTPVQATTIPVFLSHKDVVVQAQTGSGKTLAFIIPCFEIMLRRTQAHKKYEVGVIIVSPTQELAQQIHEVFQLFTEKVPRLTLQLVTGASDPRAFERNYLKNGANVIVATPGRLCSMVQHVKKLDMRQLEVLVLDEADRLLDMGFDRQLRAIITKLPKQRRTGLFSATQTRQVDELIKVGLRNPVTIDVQVTKRRKNNNNHKKPGSASSAEKDDAKNTNGNTTAIPEKLRNWYVVVDPREKLNFLVDFLQKHSHEKCIVFFLTCACVDYFALILPKIVQRQKKGQKGGSVPKIFQLHGRMSTKKRNKQFSAFKQSKTGALLCTDVAARGIDLPDLHWILQHDPPLDPSFFIHRIGRTSRAGRDGNAIVMFMPTEQGYVEYLKTRNVPITAMTTGYASIIPPGDPRLANSEEAPEVSAGSPSSGTTKQEKPLKTTDEDNGGPNNKNKNQNKNKNKNAAVGYPPLVQKVHMCAKEDRAVMEAGQRAFVSFVRAYKEHELAYTMLFRALPFAQIADGYGLLFFPKMPDIKHLHIKFRNPLRQIKPNDIKFKDPKREKQRQKNLVARREKNEAEKKEREARAAEKEKNKRKQTPKRRRKRVHQEMKEEWEELQREANLMKKLKKGKMSKRDFLKAVGEEAMSDDGL